MKKFLLALAVGVLFFAGPSNAQPQNPGLRLQGAFTPGNCVNIVSRFVVQDAGVICNAVLSVFGRTGAVTAQTGDYLFSQIGGTLGCTQLPAFTGDIANVNCAVQIAAGVIVNADINASAAISISKLGNMNANSVLANGTASPAVPASFGMPSCTGAANALQWLTNTGFQCGTITATLGSIADKQLLANTSGVSAAPIGTSATGYFDSAYCNTLGYVIARFTSVWTCARSMPVNVTWLGAVGDGVANDTAVIQAALNTGYRVYLQTPSVCYLVSADLLVGGSSQTIFGDGQFKSNVCVKSNAGFSLGVFRCNGPAPGPIFRDFSIDFLQPDPTTGTIAAMRAQLTQYKAAIWCQGTPRVTIERVGLTNAWTGADLNANTGGTIINDFRGSAYNGMIFIDGAQDKILANSVECFGDSVAVSRQLTTNQLAVFTAPPTVCISVGRVDGLTVSNLLNISALGIQMFHGATGDPWVECTDCHFDSYSGVVQAAGTFQMTNGYFTMKSGAAGVGLFAHNFSGGWAQFTNVNLGPGSPDTSPFFVHDCSACSLNIEQLRSGAPVTTVPLIDIFPSAGNNTTVSFTNSFVAMGSVAATSVLRAQNVASAFNRASVSNIIVDTTFGFAYSQPLFNFGTSWRVYATGIRANDKGAGAGTLITKAASDYDWISGNIGTAGWTYSFPAPGPGFYLNNVN